MWHIRGVICAQEVHHLQLWNKRYVICAQEVHYLQLWNKRYVICALTRDFPYLWHIRGVIRSPMKTCDNGSEMAFRCLHSGQKKRMTQGKVILKYIIMV